MGKNQEDIISSLSLEKEKLRLGKKNKRKKYNKNLKGEKKDYGTGKVVQYSIKGYFIKIWKNVFSAEKYGYYHTGVMRACKKIQLHAFKFQWRYLIDCFDENGVFLEKIGEVELYKQVRHRPIWLPCVIKKDLETALNGGVPIKKEVKKKAPYVRSTKPKTPNMIKRLEYLEKGRKKRKENIENRKLKKENKRRRFAGEKEFESFEQMLKYQTEQTSNIVKVENTDIIKI